MTKKILTFIIWGLVWLLIYSIPVSADRNLFDSFQAHLLESRPVHWLKAQLVKGVDSSMERVEQWRHSKADLGNETF